MSTKFLSLMILKVLSVLAYLSCCLQILWSLAPYLKSIINSEFFLAFIARNDAAPQPIVSPASHEPSGLEAVIFFGAAIIIVIVLFAFVIFVFRHAPAMIAKSGREVTRRPAELLVPVITHHATLAPKKRRFLTARLVFDSKLAIVSLPLIFVLVSPPAHLPIARELFLFVAALLAGWSLLLFCLQIVIAKLKRIELTQIW